MVSPTILETELYQGCWMESRAPAFLTPECARKRTHKWVRIGETVCHVVSPDRPQSQRRAQGNLQPDLGHPGCVRHSGSQARHSPPVARSDLLCEAAPIPRVGQACLSARSTRAQKTP